MSVQDMGSSFPNNLVDFNSESGGNAGGAHGEALSNSISPTEEDAFNRYTMHKQKMDASSLRRSADSDSKSIGNDVDVLGTTIACSLINQIGRASEESAMSKEDNGNLDTGIYPRPG